MSVQEVVYAQHAMESDTPPMNRIKDASIKALPYRKTSFAGSYNNRPVVTTNQFYLRKQPLSPGSNCSYLGPMLFNKRSKSFGLY